MIAGELVYIGGLFFLYYLILVGAIAGYRGGFLAVLAVVFLGCIAIFRGAVGTEIPQFTRPLLGYRALLIMIGEGVKLVSFFWQRLLAFL